MSPSAPASLSFEHEWWLDAGEFKTGAWLFREGEPVHEVFTISQGLVRLVRAGPNGRPIAVGLRWPGSVIGGVSITLNEAHRCSASALLPTKVRRLPALTLRARLSAQPEVVTQVIDAVIAEFRGTLEDSTRIFLQLPQQRLRELLCARFLGGGNGGDRELPAEIRLPHTIVRSDLPDLLHVSQARLNHLLSIWEHAGVVRRGGDTIAFNLPALCADDPDAAKPATIAPERTAAAIASPPLQTVTDQRVYDAIELIRQRCTDTRVNLRQVSRQVNLSLWHLSRLFRRSTGLGFREFVNAVRLEHARVALETTHLSVKEIAALVGYSHTSALTRRFKAKHGMSPTTHRARLAQR